MDFVSRLAVLGPRALVSTTRFDGVYAAHPRLRKVATPVQEQPIAKVCSYSSGDPARRDLRISRARLLARVVQVDVFRSRASTTVFRPPRGELPGAAGCVTLPG